MKKWLLFALLSLIAILCQMCRELHNGKIIDKHFTPGYYYTSMQQVGKAYIPQTHYVQPSYRFTVEGKNKKGELISEYWYVSSGIYELKKIGDYVSDGTKDY